MHSYSYPFLKKVFPKFLAACYSKELKRQCTTLFRENQYIQVKDGQTTVATVDLETMDYFTEIICNLTPDKNMFDFGGYWFTINKFPSDWLKILREYLQMRRLLQVYHKSVIVSENPTFKDYYMNRTPIGCDYYSPFFTTSEYLMDDIFWRDCNFILKSRKECPKIEWLDVFIDWKKYAACKIMEANC